MRKLVPPATDAEAPLARARHRTRQPVGSFAAMARRSPDTVAMPPPADVASLVLSVEQKAAGAAHRAAPAPPGRARAVVLESCAAHTPADRLDEEFAVAMRLLVPIDPERLNAVLARCRPKFLLLKHSLDTLDERLLTTCLAYDIQVLVLARPVYGLLRPARMRRFGGLPWLQLRSGSGHRGEAWVKRGVDLGLAMLSMPLVLPLMMLIAAVVSVGGSPLYFQQRVGAGGRLFRMVKFRTMRVGAERDTGPAMASPNDSRITRVGRVLRRTRLDELPQLWNVLRGDMSLVGPRPERPEFITEFRRLPQYDLRHLIRPGLTGIAQLTGGYAASVEEKLRCDLLYLNCRSPRLDLMLLMLTVRDLLRGFPRG